MPLAAADYEIANMALDHLHVTVKIGALNEVSEQAKAANRWYDTIRLKLLKAHPWRFAGRRVALTADNDAAHQNPHWQRAFVPPDDMVKPRGFVLSGYRNVPADWKIPFEWGNLPDGSGTAIYTDFPADATTPFAYTTDVSDVAVFPDHFISAFAAALAVKLAVPLRVNEKIFKSAIATWQMEWTDAMNDEASGQVHETPDASWILARL